MKHIKIFNQSNPISTPIIAKYCQSFFCQLRGLMFTKVIPDDYGLLLVQSSDSRLSASIHMMFMWMDLAIIWINSEFSVVDTALARRWKVSYIPKHPARYVLETSTSHMSEFRIGDRVRFDTITAD